MAPPTTPAWPVLHEGLRRVLRELLIHGAQSRTDVARKLDVSRANLSRLARELVDLGLISEGPPQHTTTRGRPPELLQLEPGFAHLLGVKLTGDHLYAVVTDLGATVVAERTEPLEARDPVSVADHIARVGRELLAGRALPAAAGVCLAGDVLERNGVRLVEQSRFLGWDSVPLSGLLQERFDQPVTVVNDVFALTAAHHWFGAGVGHASLVVFGLGAGIGAGVVAFEEVLAGAHGRAGHVGHARLDAVGRPCESGHDNCVHAFVTMGAITFNAGAAEEDYDSVVGAARAGDARAMRAFELAARALGIAIAESVNTIDPEKVLVTGEGVHMIELAPAGLAAGLAEHLEQVSPSSVVIERPPFSFSHYARGAAVSAMRDLLR